MSLTRPYYRIIHPGVERPGAGFVPNYVLSKKYASDRLQLSRAYRSIERDLRNIFDYIEPGKANKDVYSFQLYALLLRACTEVELNCKEIMEANGAKAVSGGHYTMKDYEKLETSSKLSKYKVVFKNWRKIEPESAESTNLKESRYEDKEFQPFASFGWEKPKEPAWYNAYNKVKHNRESELELANLENCMNAVAGILVLLYSQFGSQCIEPNKSNIGLWEDLTAYDLMFDADVIFSINPPKREDWQADELYDFDWGKVNDSDKTFEKFDFS